MLEGVFFFCHGESQIQEEVSAVAAAAAALGCFFLWRMSVNEGSAGEAIFEQASFLSPFDRWVYYSVSLQVWPPSSARWRGPGAPRAQTLATAPPTG